MLLDGELVTKALWIPNLQENLKFSRNSIGKAFIKQSNSIFPSKVSWFSYFFSVIIFFHSQFKNVLYLIPQLLEIQHVPRINSFIPNVSYASMDHQRLHHRYVLL